MKPLFTASVSLWVVSNLLLLCGLAIAREVVY
jgi:hypothetical protein